MNSEQKLSLKIEADTGDAKKEMEELAKIGKNMSHQMVKSLSNIAFKGADAQKTIKGLALSFSNMFKDMALQPLQNSNPLFADVLSSLFPNEKGNVYSKGTLVPFAEGGIVGSPTLFPMSGGKTGLLGEAGPEAILPLKRGSDGKLGVASNNHKQNININFNVTAQDSESFLKSESQISAMMSRISQRGYRNL